MNRNGVDKETVKNEELHHNDSHRSEGVDEMESSPVSAPSSPSTLTSASDKPSKQALSDNVTASLSNLNLYINSQSDPAPSASTSAAHSSIPPSIEPTPTAVAEIIQPETSDGSSSILQEDSPPPTRPSPTAIGRQLSSTPQPNGAKGMASAPAVQTLSGIKSDSSSPSTPVADPAIRPSVSNRPSQIAGTTGAIRRPGVVGSGGLSARIPPSLQAKMAAMASRSNNPTSISLSQNTHLGAGERISTSSLFKTPTSSSSSSGTSTPVGLPGGLPSLAGRPSSATTGAPDRIGAMGPVSGRGLGGPSGLSKRRGPGAGLTLGQMGASDGSSIPGGSGPGGRINGAGLNLGGAMGRPKMQLPGGLPGANGVGNNGQQGGGNNGTGTPFANFSKIVDPSGSLNFQNKAVLHATGVDFSNGSSFKINMGELELQDELGSGNYGTVQKVFHKVTKVTMAMKEIRLELDDSKLKAIITELDILHRATAHEIVEFYGAFFIESCVYYCMEFMDAGSLDKFAGCTVPEPVLKRVTGAMVRGLKFLKDELQIMHRDVKPTNVLINTAGAIKLCDFGVSGQLERSLAKTNIGCQSYMAPERIKGGDSNFLGTYSVASDVWSLGLTIIEFAVGHHPYPPETYSNVFAQLQAIVHGEPPGLPNEFSREAGDFVARSLIKDDNKRPNYGQMQHHPFLKDEPTLDVDMVGWVRDSLEVKRSGRLAGSSSSSSSTSV